MALVDMYEVSALYVGSDDKAGIEETVEDNIYTIRAYYKKVNSNIPYLSDFIKLVKYSVTWRKAIKLYTTKKGKPDIITANIIFPASVIVRRLRKKWEVPYIITEHWTGYFPEDGRYKGMFMKWLARKAVKNAGAVITDSNRLKKRMSELNLVNHYYSIPNVVDSNLFKISVKNRDPSKEFKFVHVSALDDDQKNVSGIIHAFQKLAKIKHGVSLTIVGDGDNKAQLMEMADTEVRNKSIKFTGSKTGEELVGILNEADAFILFSNYENLPCVMLEAMCCGLPVIASNVGDVAEYINPGNGILINPGDEAALYKAMEEIMTVYGKYDRLEIRAGVENKVTPQAVARQFKEVYDSVLNK